MSYVKLKSYAVNAVGNVIPVDKESCKELVDYALTLPSNQAIQSHFLELLGETEVSLTFINKFLQLKQEEDAVRNKKAPSSKTTKSPEPIPPKTQNNKNSNAWTVPSKSENHKPSKGRLDKAKTSTNTSELLDLKPSNQLTAQQAKKNKRKNIDNLKDIDAILSELELKPSNDVIRVCNCMATRHPLFELSPNCLNCGKIICVKEGLQPCSYCGQDLLNYQERKEIMDILREEKDELENKQEHLHNKKVQEQKTPLTARPKSKKIVVKMNAGENLWKAQDRALKEADAESKRLQEQRQLEESERKELEQQEKELKHFERTNKINPELLKAQERLDTLLHFQDTGAERTKIIDNAADYELPTTSSSNIWLSPVERALQLKKQHKQLRKHEETQKSRTGRGNVTVEMVIKNGKVTMVEKQYAGSSEVPVEEDPDIRALEEKVRDHKNQTETDLTKNIWDYESDKLKWEKPVYSGSASKKSTSDEAEAPKPRVQFAFESDQNELLVAIP